MIIDPDLRNEITRNLTVTLPEATIRDENLVNYMMHILNKIGSIEKQKKVLRAKFVKILHEKKWGMRLFFLCELIAQSVEIPKCPEPELNQGRIYTDSLIQERIVCEIAVSWLRRLTMGVDCVGSRYTKFNFLSINQGKEQR